MLGFVDGMRKPLQIPPKFIPYLEKHQIYELFYEIATQLVIKKPSDHILYMKQCLHHAARSRNSPRIILFAPPNFDKNILAEYLAKKLGIRSITLQHVSCIESDAGELAKNVRNILKECYFHNVSGWIFTDFPRDKFEARALQRIGILPTHVIEIVWTVVTSDCSSTYHDTIDSNESVMNLYEEANKSQHSDYNSRIRGLREAYANFLITVETAERTYEELGNACIALTRKRKYYVPCIFRIILIGSRGSGRREVAKYLSHTYGLVHVDFHYLLEQTRQQKSSLGNILQCIERQSGKMPPANTRIKVVENKLMSHECIKRGWILTGYPITVEDFQLLDSITTPPNRIIYLNVCPVVCRKRLLSRRFNVITGSEHHLVLDENFKSYQADDKLTKHPKDHRNRVEQDLQKYAKNIEAILEYAGESVVVINGMADKRIVCERVEESLAQPMTSAPLRTSKLSKIIDPMDIEFDLDDEPDPQIINSIRARESILSLI